MVAAFLYMYMLFDKLHVKTFVSEVEKWNSENEADWIFTASIVRTVHVVSKSQISRI